ncbi:MAG TPA: DUF3224 domain-containing protein [Candidatus Bathyarchaeia archaeon]
MRKNSLIYLLLSVLLLLVFPHPLTAYATVPISGGGTIADIEEPVTTLIRQANGILILQQTGAFMMTGTFSGTGETNFIFIGDMSTGRLTLHGQATFNGNVGEASGSAVLAVVGRSDGTTFTVKFTIQGGTGGLSNLRGEGTVNVMPSGSATYTVMYHFDPS